jgi:hypothetical protein
MYISGRLIVCIVIIVISWVTRSNAAAAREAAAVVTVEHINQVEPLGDVVNAMWIEARRWKRQLEAHGQVPHTDPSLMVSARRAAQRFFDLSGTGRRVPETATILQILEQVFDKVIDSDSDALAKQPSFEKPKKVEPPKQPIGETIERLQSIDPDERIAAIDELGYEPTAVSPLVGCLQEIDPDISCEHPGDCHVAFNALGRLGLIVSSIPTAELVALDRKSAQAEILRYLEHLIKGYNSYLFREAVEALRGFFFDKDQSGRTRLLTELTRIATLPEARGTNIDELKTRVVSLGELLGFDVNPFVNALNKDRSDS